MKLNIKPRSTDIKSNTNAIRREGHIPAVLYVRGKASEPISIDAGEYKTLMRQIPSGRLSTTIFTLVGEKGKERKAVLKEVQHHVTSYDAIHLDFEEVFPDVKVNVKVPIECSGVVDCAGVKQGGNLRQVIRSLRVRCLPADIPQVFELDVKTLGMFEVRTLADLNIPSTVRPLADLKEVAAVVGKR